MAGYVLQNTKVLDAEVIPMGDTGEGILDMERVDQIVNSDGECVFPYHIDAADGSFKLDYAVSGDGVTYSAAVGLITAAKPPGSYFGIFEIPLARFIKFIVTETSTVADLTITVGIANRFYTYNI